MKKLLLGLLAILLVLGALIFYQRQKVSDSLAELLKGKTYSSYGIKIEIPPSEGSIHGFFRPYVNLPKVILDLSMWGVKRPLAMEEAVAFQDLWGEGAIILEIPRTLTPLEGIIIQYPTAELGLNQDIQLLGAQAVIFEKKAKADSLNRLALAQPQLKLGSSEEKIPKLMVASLEGMEYFASREQQEMKLGSINLGLESKRAGNLRHWELFFLGQGGYFKDASRRSELGGWKLRIRGTAQDIPEETVEVMARGSSRLGNQWASDLGDSKRILGEFLEYGLLFFKRSQAKITSKELGWDGLKIVNNEGGEEVLITPLITRINFQEEDGNLRAEADGSLRQVKFMLEDGSPLNMENLRFRYSSKYNVNFAQLTEHSLKFYQAWLNGTHKQRFLSTLAHSPDWADLNFKIGKIHYLTKNSEADHADFNLNFSVEDENLGLRMGDKFSFHALKETRQDIREGNSQFSLTLKVPWQGIVRLSRQALMDPQADINFVQPFLNRESGFDMEFNLDLGPQYFVFAMAAKLSVPLDRTWEESDVPASWDQWKLVSQWWGRLRPHLIKQFAEKGLLEFNVQVDRLSKFQAALDHIKAGASLGLVVLAPYTEVDPMADTMKMKLKYQDGEVLINGQPNAALQKMLTPSFQKYGVSLTGPGVSPATPGPSTPEGTPAP